MYATRLPVITASRGLGSAGITWIPIARCAMNFLIVGLSITHKQTKLSSRHIQGESKCADLQILPHILTLSLCKGFGWGS